MSNAIVRVVEAYCLGCGSRMTMCGEVPLPFEYPASTVTNDD